MVVKVNVTVLATDSGGNPVADARVTARLSIQDVDPTYGYILPENVTEVTGTDGIAVLALWPNARGSTASHYDFKITNPDSPETLRLTATLPESDCNLHDVALLPPYPGKSETQLSTEAAAASAAAAGAAKDLAIIARTGAETARTGAETAQGAAAGSASTASGAATTATTAATNAGTSATAADGSAIAAAGSATSANAAKVAAEAARDAAVLAKTGAETAQTAAGISAGNASTSAGNASTSAGTAATQAGNAAGSATAADGSAIAAAGSASAAAGSAIAASGSATAAATSAAALSGTSATSLAIALGTKTFVTQVGKQFGAGVPLIAISAGTPTKYMMGTSAAYSGGSLDIAVTSIGGTGSAADWNILVCGLRGVTGSKGLNWRGAWDGATAYLTDDLTTNAGSTWRRKTDGTSATAPGSDATNWEIAALKGTDGSGSVVTVNTISPVAGDVTITSANIAENTNLYFTAARVLANVLTGLSTATNAAITAGDSVLSAFGKLQKQITDHIAALTNVENKSSATIRGEITSSNVTTALTFTPANAALIGANSGIAQLDSGGKVPAAQLPAYVDDVLEYANFAALPGTGASGIIYITIDTTPAKQYRWTGSAYQEMVSSPGTTDAITEGSTNLYFTAARVLAAVLSGLSLATNAAITSADTVLGALGKLQKQITDMIAAKDATGGYAGLTLFKINFRNAANTFTSFFTNANAAARTYTFQDRDGTIADSADIALKASLTGDTFTGTVSLNGATNALAAVLINAAEKITVSATAPTGTINFDATTQALLYYTSSATANWTLNLRGNSSNSLNSILATGQSITVAFLATQGSTPYLPSAFQVDGTAITPKWQGGVAPTAGNASGIDIYTYTIIKLASASFIVLASQAQFK